MNKPTDFDISLEELPARRVAFVRYETNQTAGGYDDAIRQHFDQVKAWVQDRGGDTTALPAIGIADVHEGQLRAYECCIPIPDDLPTEDPNMSFKMLPGGPHAVLHIDKQGTQIGETIGRFFQEYVPDAPWQIDGSRPTYEVHWAETLDFCVPIIL